MNNTYEKQAGFSLIELLVGMTIGVFILGAITSVYLSSRQTARTNQALAHMQDSGKLALELLAAHIAHAGFIGRTALKESIAGTATDTTPLTYTFSGTECAANWSIDLRSSLRVFNGTNPYSSTCINGVTTGETQWSWAAGSDVLELRNAGTATLLNAAGTALQTTPDNGQVYLIGDINGGRLFFGNTPPALANYSPASRGVFPVNSYAYFVAQRSMDEGATWYPALMRVETGPSGSAFRAERVEVVSGIEDLQIEVGIDNDLPRDGQVDVWQAPTATMDFDTVTALRVWILVRAPDIDTSFNSQGDTVTYYLGGTTVTRNDQFRRLAMMRTVAIKSLN